MSFEGQKVLMSLHYQITGNLILTKNYEWHQCLLKDNKFLFFDVYTMKKIDIYSKGKMKMHHQYNEKWRKLWWKYCALMKYDV